MTNQTMRTRIRGTLRQMWLRSSERSAALKRDGYCCQKCGVKQSKKKGFEQKVEVHHVENIDVWDEIISLIQEKILCSPDKLRTLCPQCHKLEK